MDHLPNEQSRTARTARWFQASPAELVGLAILMLGSVVASGALWFQAVQRPAELGSGAATAGVAVGPDRSADGPAPGIEDRPGTGSDARSDTEVTVHVTGAVIRPGVVVLPYQARVGDAVEAAGGLRADAQRERVNLARSLVDGEHVHVLAAGEGLSPPSDPAPPSTTASAGITPDGRVDLNRANQAELETLPGVGPARAEAIVTHREEHGPFDVPGDLRGVPGIGEVTFQRMADLLTVE